MSIGQGTERQGGLSLTHTRTRAQAVSPSGTLMPAMATVWEGGSLVKVRRERSRPEPGSGPPAGGGKRGRITFYTPAVRQRCLQTIAKVKRSERPVLMTLTYPSWWPVDYSQFSQHKRRFHERMRRRWPGVGCVFVREHHADGRPHIHGLAFGLSDEASMLAFRRWVARAWYEAVAIEDGRSERHLRAGTSVERARTARGARSYLTKYASKAGSQKAVAEPWGRWWWVHNEASVPWAMARAFRLDDRAAVRLMRYARKLYHMGPRYRPALSWVTDSADWERLVSDMAASPT